MPRAAKTAAAFLILWNTTLAAQSILNVAGGGIADGRLATSIPLSSPASVAVDSAGNLYIAERQSHRVRKISAATGIITTLAGNGTEGFSGDGGSASEAVLNEPSAVALDAAGNIYIADSGNYRIRMVDARTLQIASVVGTVAGFFGDNGPAAQARLGRVSSITFSPQGDLFIVDASNDRVRRVSGGVITTFAGSGFGYSGDGGQATAATFRLSGPNATEKFTVRPQAAFDAAGNLYISDFYNHAVRRVDRGGTITAFAGTGTQGTDGDGGQAANARISQPAGVAVDSSGSVFISENGSGRIRKVTNGVITTFAGSVNGFGGDGGPATSALFLGPSGLMFDRSGDLLIADYFNDRVRKISRTGNLVSTIAGGGNFSGDGGVATAALLFGPTSVAVDSTGALTIAEYRGDRVRRVAPDGRISTVAGTGEAGFSGDGGLATAARLAYPGTVVSDRAGNLFIADLRNNCVRRVAASNGAISTYAGTCSRGSGGDGGPATSAQLNLSSPDAATAITFGYPAGLAIDSSSDLYIADTFNDRIRKVSASTQIITTIAGTVRGFGGDGGQATAAQLERPTGLAVDRNNLYVADAYNHRIRKIDLLTGMITSAVGSGGTGGRGSGAYGGDNGPATAARLFEPTGVAVDAAGNLYIADKLNGRIRKVSGGTITTIAGQGRTQAGFTGDGGSALLTRLSDPHGVAVDSRNNVFIADTDANRVRAVYACVNVAAPRLTSPANSAVGVTTAPTLTWDRVDGAFRYDIYLSQSNPPALFAADLTSTAFVPSNLVPAGTYFWRVVAKGDPFCPSVSTASSDTRSFTVASSCNAPSTFSLSQPADGAASVSRESVPISWQASPGAATYDLYLGPANPPPFFARGLTTTTTSVTNLAADTTYYWFVVAHGACDAARVTGSSTRSFRTAGACGAAGTFAQTTPRDGATDVAATSTLQWSASTNASSYELYLGTSSPPPLYLHDVRSTAVSVSGLAPSTRYFWRVVAKVACDPSRAQSTATSSFVTAGSCPTPASSSITFVPSGNVGVGQTYTIAWSEAPGLDTGGVYIVERSLSQTFTTLVDSQETFSTSASFISNSAGTYYHRVRAIPGCGPPSQGSVSGTRSVPVVSGSANAIFTVQPQAIVASVNERLEDKRTSFTLENLGNSALQVRVDQREINSVPFFTISDPLGDDSLSVTLEPRKPKTLEVRFSGPPTDKAAAFQGIIFVTAIGQSLAVTPSAFVNLKIGGGSTSRPKFVMNGRPTEYVFFPGFSGEDEKRPPITIEIRNDGSAPMELAAEIGPEVWLVPEEGWNATAIAPGASRPVNLTTRRNQATNGSALPRYTYFTVRSRNGETVRLLVQDNDALTTAFGRSSLLEPGSRSVIVPGMISTTIAFGKLSLTNVGSDPVQAELFFTPAGADGFDGSVVKRATIVVPPNDVVTLTDPLLQVFGLPQPAEGSIEIRAAPERIAFLIVAASVVSPVSSGGSYGYQLPAIRFGEGAQLGSAHVIAGVATGSTLRSHLTLIETSGRDTARVRLKLSDDRGAQRGERTFDIRRYGSEKVDLTALSGGASIDSGRVDITVESGGGLVTGTATVLDASLNTGATLVSQPVSGGVLASVLRTRTRQPSAELATAIVPVVVSGPMGGNKVVRTSMGFGLGSGPASSLLVTYRQPGAATAPVERTLPLTPNTILKFDNVLEQLFGITPGSAAQGLILIRGPAEAQAYARLMSSTGGGPFRPEASLPIYPTSLSEVISSLSSRRPLYLDGLEQSIDATRGSSWAVVITETAGSSGSVRVRLYEAGNRSLPIAEKTLSIAPNEQLRLDTVFVALDLDIAERRKDRTNVLCVVMTESGGAVISAVGVVTDNATLDSKHFLFSPNGGVPATGVTRLSAPLATPVLPSAPVKKRRAVR